MRPAFRWGMLTGALVTGVPVVAYSAPDLADREAQARFEEGIRRVKAGDFDAARVSFTQAYAVLHRPSILWNLALSEEKTGRVLDALTHFKQVARDLDATDDDRGEAQKHADALMTQTGHVEVQAPAGAAFTIDGGPVVGKAPLGEALDVAPGRHVIEARLGQDAKSVTVDAVPGVIAHVRFLTVDAPQGHGLSASTGPAAEAQRGQVLAPSHDELADISEAHPRRNKSSPPSEQARAITVVAIGGAAALAFGLGAYLGIQSQNDASTAADYANRYGTSGCLPGHALATPCSQWSDIVQAQNRNAELSTGLYVAAGALAAGAVVVWFVWPREGAGRPATAWLGPVALRAGTGLAAGGEF